jgi:hypothetical protein
MKTAPLLQIVLAHQITGDAIRGIGFGPHGDGKVAGAEFRRLIRRDNERLIDLYPGLRGRFRGVSA